MSHFPNLLSCQHLSLVHGLIFLRFINLNTTIATTLEIQTRYQIINMIENMQQYMVKNKAKSWKFS